MLSIAMPFEGERELGAALALLTVIDLFQLVWFQLPDLYASGVRYRQEQAKQCWHPIPGGCEDWNSAWEVVRQGVGDCEDLACYRAADLIRAGERARAIARKTRTGWHIVVRRENGSIEDPSANLGMGRT